MKPDRETNYLPTLDGWRAVAIVGVLIYHGTTSLFYPSGPYPSYDALKVIQVGNRGVDIFFAISGFLICSRLIQERQRTGRISLLGFYVRRAFRIMPPFLVFLGVLAALTAAGTVVVEGREFVASLLFVRNYVGPAAEHGWYTGHFWSLAVEEHFYLLWPLLLVVSGNRRARPVALIAALVVPVWAAADAQLGGITTVPRNMRTDIRLDALLWGCWTALVLSVPTYRAWATRWLRPWAWAGIVAALLALARFEPLGERHLQAFLMPWLLAGTILNPGWRVSRLLEAGAVRWVGRLSYSLYIWQQLWMMGSWKVARPFPLGPLQELPLCVLCTFGCAALSYYLVERPTIRLGGRLTRGRSAVRPPAQPEPQPALAS